MLKNVFKTLFLWAFLFFSLVSTQTNSHTNSIGYVGEGAGTVTFWYGSWHSNTTFNEGSLQLVGSNGTFYGPVVTPFNLFSATVPSGLVAGTNYFQSNGTTLVPYGQGTSVSYVYQGVRFTNLQPGQYTFTYIPLGNPLSYAPNSTPTLDWMPQDSVILSSTVTLTSAIISPPGTPPTLPPTPVYTGPSPIHSAASLIRSAYAQLAAYQYRVNSLFIGLVNYDCNNFGEYNVCMSVAVKTGTVVDYGNDFAGIVTFAYRPVDFLRMGGFIEQSVSNPSFDGVAFRSSEPTVGLFAVAEEDKGDTGFKLRTAYSRSSDRLRITRETIGTSQPGSGQAGMSTVGYGVEASYGFEIEKDWVVAPYAGVWRITTDRKAYQENNVSYPISYNNNTFSQNTVTAGLRVLTKLDDNIKAVFGVGIEKDIDQKQSDISGSSNILGAESFALAMPTLSDSIRYVGTIGLAFNLGDNQSLITQGIVRQTPEASGVSGTSTVSASALIKYSIGF